jgi:hypothetical protein
LPAFPSRSTSSKENAEGWHAVSTILRRNGPCRACCRKETPEIQRLRRVQWAQKNVRNFISLVAAHSDTLMKNAGISPAIVQDIIGHESVAISQNYGRID